MFWEDVEEILEFLVYNHFLGIYFLSFQLDNGDFVNLLNFEARFNQSAMISILQNDMLYYPN